MIKIEFTKEDIPIIDAERNSHYHPIVRRRMQALFLKFKNLPHKDIAEYVGISEKTLRNYLTLYQEGGLLAVRELHYQGQPSSLEEYADEIIASLEADPVSSLKEAQHRIEELTGIKRSLPCIRNFLKKKGLVRRKIKQTPAKIDAEKQEEFINQTLNPLIAKAQEHKIHLFFVDAAHFVFATFLGYLYSRMVSFIRAQSGRKRFNVLGALHLMTKELVTITNHSYISSVSVYMLLEKLAAQFRDLPIVLVMDNARYQKCQWILEKAEELHIELVFLPSYSPNLNLIERLWRFVKKEVLYNSFYPTYEQFWMAISDCIGKTNTLHKESIDSLITPKFQSFKNITSYY